MSTFVNKLKSWVAGDHFEDDLYEYEDEAMDYAEPSAHEPTNQVVASPRNERRNLKVVDHPSSTMAQVVVVEPKTFDEALDIIHHLKSRKAVILNLQLLDTAHHNVLWISFLAPHMPLKATNNALAKACLSSHLIM
jgi:cell division inhibitor SepF